MKTLAQFNKNRTRKDWLVSRLVTFFGIGVLATMLIMIWHLFSQTFPLFLSPWFSVEQSIALPQSLQGKIKGFDDNNQLIVQGQDCALQVLDINKLASLNNLNADACPQHLDIANPELPSDNLLKQDTHALALPALNYLLRYDKNILGIFDHHQEKIAEHTLAFDIVWLATLTHNRSIFIAYNNGTVERWVVVNQAGNFVFKPSYSIQLQANEKPMQISAHANSNAVFLLTDNSRLLLLNRVTGELLTDYPLSATAHYFKLVDDQLTLVFQDHVEQLSIHNLAGVNTFNALFKPQLYEGYEDEQYIYQTSAASDFMETKYALVPLFIGSLKVALSAMLVAVPLALGAAVFTGYFSKNKWRYKIKSSIEMLEAVPSVIIAFIAAVILLPLVDTLLLGIAIFVVSMPIVGLGLAYLQSYLTAYGPHTILDKGKVIGGFVAVIVWAMVCLYLARVSFDSELFFGLSRSTLVIAVALGVAISPTIYTLADDAIFSVPDTLKNGSFALGATQLQTLSKVVLRMAKPGLIAALMLGFGRAIGETMIVLMVSGNTPIADWSLFTSVRALTANIAIELTEPKVGSPLYTLLFFTALVLFLFTFIFNTIAEILRYQVRKAVVNE